MFGLGYLEFHSLSSLSLDYYFLQCLHVLVLDSKSLEVLVTSVWITDSLLE